MRLQVLIRRCHFESTSTDRSLHSFSTIIVYEEYMIDIPNGIIGRGGYGISERGAGRGGGVQYIFSH